MATTPCQVASCGNEAEQALVENRIGPLDRTAEGRPVGARGGDDDAVRRSQRRKPSGKAARRDDHGRRAGATDRQGLGQLGGAQELTAIGEPDPLAALAVRGDKDEAGFARTRAQRRDAGQDALCRGRFGCCPRPASRSARGYSAPVRRPRRASFGPPRPRCRTRAAHCRRQPEPPATPTGWKSAATASAASSRHKVAQVRRMRSGDIGNTGESGRNWRRSHGVTSSIAGHRVAGSGSARRAPPRPGPSGAPAAG